MQTDYLVLFNYQAYSFRGEKLLQGLGLTVDFIPTPKQYKELCANSLRVRGIELEKLKAVLEEQGINYAAIHPYQPSKLTRSFIKEQFSNGVEAVFQKIREDIPLVKDEIELLFNLADSREQDYFYSLASQVRNQMLGKKIVVGAFIRWGNGWTRENVIQFTNCLTTGEIKYLMLQLEELVDWDNFLELLPYLKEVNGLKILITGGASLFLHYRDLQKLEIPYIFKMVTLEEQQQFLTNPQEVLEEIFYLWQQGKSDLLGLSPLLPMTYPSNSAVHSLGKTITALLRVLFKDALLPAFNCSTSLQLEEQLANGEAGANLILVDATSEMGQDSKWELEKAINLLTGRGYAIA